MLSLSDLLSQRPHIFVSGVDHSGTSLIVKLLKACGWRDRCDTANDKKHEEDIEFRAINDALLFRKTYLENPLKEMTLLWESVRKSDYPIVIKDPRFLFTLPLWGTLPNVFDQTFILVERNTQSVIESHKRREEPPLCRYPPLWNGSIEMYQEWARHIYNWWPGSKVLITDEMISSCVPIIDVKRLLKGHD